MCNFVKIGFYPNVCKNTDYQLTVFSAKIAKIPQVSYE